MSITSAIAIYFIIWWACLFAVLPWGVHNAHEAGQSVGEGHDSGAPVNPMLWRKALATTILATIAFAFVYGIITQGWINFH
jgi:predicted secreted protein